MEFLSKILVILVSWGQLREGGCLKRGGLEPGEYYFPITDKYINKQDRFLRPYRKE